ncbi:hypothetical protein PIB30_078899 [Stylosanthes scabra]|uniref:Uncharacterized protein n=1 Tax=Stylosanthes scabra TaxID=79078 RepID=A0ABU6UUQ7_9FABA|nr:hypothetical protein [Stylosanthes scabra]
MQPRLYRALLKQELSASASLPCAGKISYSTFAERLGFGWMQQSALRQTGCGMRCRLAMYCIKRGRKMEAAPQKSKGKLTQTQSALLRSSPTTTTTTRKTRRISAQSPGRAGWADGEGDFNQTPAVACVGFLAACSIVLYVSYFFDEIPTSENVLLVLIFIAVALHLVSKNKRLINRSVSGLKLSWEENLKRLGLSQSQKGSKPVQLFIGETWKREK